MALLGAVSSLGPKFKIAKHNNTRILYRKLLTEEEKLHRPGHNKILITTKLLVLVKCLCVKD